VGNSSMILHGAQNLSQLSGAELAGSARTVAISGETGVGHKDEIKRARTQEG
jgi:hypothetical protein